MVNAIWEHRKMEVVFEIERLYNWMLTHFSEWKKIKLARKTYFYNNHSCMVFGSFIYDNV